MQYFLEDEVLALNQKVNVVVLDFGEDKKRISLGLKQLTPHPWEVLVIVRLVLCLDKIILEVIFLKIKKKSVKKSSQTILALNCGRCATAYSKLKRMIITASIFNDDIRKKNNISLSSLFSQSTSILAYFVKGKPLL